MTSTKLFSLMMAGFLAAALPLPAAAQDNKKDEEAPVQPYCSPKIAEMCDKLSTYSQSGGDSWKVAMYGATACTNSRAIQTERRARRDRIEYEARLARAAKEKGEEHKAWTPRENNDEFNARTNGACDSSFAYYCGEMRREAEGLKGAEDKQASLTFVDSVCRSQTAAAPAPAAAAPAPKK